MQKKITRLFGIMITLVTLTNFVPAATTEHEGIKLLFGIFAVSTLLMTLHLLTGFGAILISFTRYARSFLWSFGGIYILMAVTGFLQGDMALGIFPVNLADNVLHTLFAIALLGIGFGVKSSPSYVRRNLM